MHQHLFWTLVSFINVAIEQVKVVAINNLFLLLPCEFFYQSSVLLFYKQILGF